MITLFIFLWLLAALMWALATARLYGRAPEDVKQAFSGYGGYKGVFISTFLIVFIIITIIGTSLYHNSKSNPDNGLRIYSGRSMPSGSTTKPLPTIQPEETKGKVTSPGLPPPLIKEPDKSITPVESEGKVRSPEPPPEITRPADRK